MTSIRTIRDTLNTLLVGRRIVEGDETGLTLSDGTRLDFYEYGECCAWADVREVASSTNVITRVMLDQEDNTLRLYALVEGSEGSDLFKVVGNEGTGYYTYGVELRVNGASVLDINRPLDL